MLTTGELLPPTQEALSNSLYRIPGLEHCASLDFSLGATRISGDEWQFVVWAPRADKVAVRIVSEGSRLIPMARGPFGYHSVSIAGLETGDRYLFQLNGDRELPDPASRFQPEGPHQASQLVDHSDFQWNDADWSPPSLERSIFYELHVGTFTPEGTFDAVIPHLDELKQLGITTIQLMPVAQFPGARNWGYDGTYPYAVQNSYGGPDGLLRLVDAAHVRGLAISMDVVYNHLGPEGNYLNEFGPYFTDRHHTPWGQAINFDGPESDHVRRFFIENAISWVSRYHIDALRLDAIHGMFDAGARHFLAELHSGVQNVAERLQRKVQVIAESDLNDARILHAEKMGGYALEAQWSDDLHHSLHSLLTGEQQGYYADFGKPEHLATCLREGWFYSGQYSQFRQRRHGNSPRGLSGSRFVVFSQNHDQVGNRAFGERLSQLVGLEDLKLAAGIVLLSPFVPLLFMGEEYGETAPFQYFTSHSDPDLAEAVRKGRRAEFSHFGWQSEVPDPQSEATFQNSKLDHRRKNQEPHRTLLRFYRKLIQMRSRFALGKNHKVEVLLHDRAPVVAILRGSKNSKKLAVIFHFGQEVRAMDMPMPQGSWKTVLNSAEEMWLGPARPSSEPVDFSNHAAMQLHPRSFVVMKQTGAAE